MYISIFKVHTLCLCVPDDHRTIGVDCDHLAAQIEEDILLYHQDFNNVKTNWTSDVNYLFHLFQAVFTLINV